MSFIWHNGVFKKDEPVLMAHDRLRLGDGVFDTLLVFQRQPVFANLHFQRLHAHASVLGISLFFTTDVLEKAAYQMVQRNEGLQDMCVIRTLVTRGPSNRGVQIPEDSRPNVIMNISEAGSKSPVLHAVIAGGVRRNEGSPLSRVKSVNYGDHILALRDARRHGANEVILLNNKNLVTCASAGNIFAVIKGRLVTPPPEDGVMPGIIRQKIIHQYGAIEQSLTIDDLTKSDGLYITNSVSGIRVIKSLNSKDMPVPGIKIDPALHLG